MAIDSEAKRWSMLQCATPSFYSLVFNPDTSGLSALERATVLKRYGGIAWQVAVPVPVDARRGGGRSRKRRRVMVDGKLHTVRTLAEERALLAQYVEQQRMALTTAEPAQEPSIRAKIRRAERRADKVTSEESIEADERLMRLRGEDDDILLLLVH